MPISTFRCIDSNFDVSIQEVAASQVELIWMMTSYPIAEITVIALAAWLSRMMSTR
jgi:hypothetical protein